MLLFLLTLQINCVTQGTSRTCGVIKSTSIGADIALQHPIQKDFKQPKPWHTSLWPRVQGRIAPPDLESKTAGQHWERWLQPSCSWRTMANTRSIPATPRGTGGCGPLVVRVGITGESKRRTGLRRGAAGPASPCPPCPGGEKTGWVCC